MGKATLTTKRRKRLENRNKKEKKFYEFLKPIKKEDGAKDKESEKHNKDDEEKIKLEGKRLRALRKENYKNIKVTLRLTMDKLRQHSCLAPDAYRVGGEEPEDGFSPLFMSDVQNLIHSVVNGEEITSRLKWCYIHPWSNVRHVMLVVMEDVAASDFEHFTHVQNSFKMNVRLKPAMMYGKSAMSELLVVPYSINHISKLCVLEGTELDPNANEWEDMIHTSAEAYSRELREHEPDPKHARLDLARVKNEPKEQQEKRPIKQENMHNSAQFSQALSPIGHIKSERLSNPVPGNQGQSIKGEPIEGQTLSDQGQCYPGEDMQAESYDDLITQEENRMMNAFMQQMKQNLIRMRMEQKGNQIGPRNIIQDMIGSPVNQGNMTGSPMNQGVRMGGQMNQGNRMESPMKQGGMVEGQTDPGDNVGSPVKVEGQTDQGNMIEGQTKSDNLIEGQTNQSDMKGGQTDQVNVKDGQMDQGNMMAGQTNQSNKMEGQMDQDNMVGVQTNSDNMMEGQMDQDNMVGVQTNSDNMMGGQVNQGNMIGGQMTQGNMMGGQVNQGNMMGGQMNQGNMMGGQMNQGNMMGGQMNQGNMMGGQMNQGNMMGGQMNQGNMMGGQMNQGNMMGGQMNQGNMMGGQVNQGNMMGGYSNQIFQSRTRLNRHLRFDLNGIGTPFRPSFRPPMMGFRPFYPRFPRFQARPRMSWGARTKRPYVPVPDLRTIRKRKHCPFKFDPNFNRLDLLLTPQQMVAERVPMPNGTDEWQKGFIFSKERYAKVTKDSPLFSMDCEMCMTTAKILEVTRVSVINEDMEMIYDGLVKPYNHIIDYLTEFSGITKEMMQTTTLRLHEAQKAISDLLPPDAIMVGQSLSGDLKVMKMYHPYIIDTSVIYNTKGGKAKTSLRQLTQMFLGREIQTAGAAGHSPIEDSAAALELVLWKLTKYREYGDVRQNWCMEIPDPPECKALERKIPPLPDSEVNQDELRNETEWKPPTAEILAMREEEKAQRRAKWEAKQAAAKETSEAAGTSTQEPAATRKDTETGVTEKAEYEKSEKTEAAERQEPPVKKSRMSIEEFGFQLMEKETVEESTEKRKKVKKKKQDKATDEVQEEKSEETANKDDADQTKTKKSKKKKTKTEATNNEDTIVLIEEETGDTKAKKSKKKKKDKNDESNKDETKPDEEIETKTKKPKKKKDKSGETQSEQNETEETKKKRKKVKATKTITTEQPEDNSTTTTTPEAVPAQAPAQTPAQAPAKKKPKRKLTFPEVTDEMIESAGKSLRFFERALTDSASTTDLQSRLKHDRTQDWAHKTEQTKDLLRRSVFFNVMGEKNLTYSLAAYTRNYDKSVHYVGQHPEFERDDKLQQRITDEGVTTTSKKRSFLKKRDRLAARSRGPPAILQELPEKLVMKKAYGEQYIAKGVTTERHALGRYSYSDVSEESQIVATARDKLSDHFLTVVRFGLDIPKPETHEQRLQTLDQHCAELEASLPEDSLLLVLGTGAWTGKHYEDARLFLKLTGADRRRRRGAAEELDNDDKAMAEQSIVKSESKEAGAGTIAAVNVKVEKN